MDGITIGKKGEVHKMRGLCYVVVEDKREFVMQLRKHTHSIAHKTYDKIMQIIQLYCSNQAESTNNLHTEYRKSEDRRCPFLLSQQVW